MLESEPVETYNTTKPKAVAVVTADVLKVEEPSKKTESTQVHSIDSMDIKPIHTSESIPPEAEPEDKSAELVQEHATPESSLASGPEPVTQSYKSVSVEAGQSEESRVNVDQQVTIRQENESSPSEVPAHAQEKAIAIEKPVSDEPPMRVAAVLSPADLQVNIASVNVAEAYEEAYELDIPQPAKMEDFDDGLVHQHQEKDRVSVHSMQITETITEDLDISVEQQSTVMALTEVLPEPVQVAVKECIETAELEQVEKIEYLVLSIAELADQLHEIADTVDQDELKAQISELYEELVSELNIELEEEQKADLIAQIQSGDFKASIKKPAMQKNDDLLHESKTADLSFTTVQATISELLGKFVVGRSSATSLVLS